GVKSPATDTLRMTCFVNAREQIEPMRVAASRVFGKAESVFVQSSRFAAGSAASCEGIARAPSGVSGRVIFTAPQMIFGEQDSDTQLGWDRLKKSVVLAGGDADHLLEVNVYTTSGISEKTNAAIKNVSQRNAMVRLFEALPSEDALMAIEVVASAK
ncbi:MAG: hypothetical protein ABI824_15250, partial [Acidobacteriota bacterium]